MSGKAMAMGNIIAATLTLVVIVFGIKIAIDLTGKPVQYLLGMGDISAFDQDIVDRYEAAKDMNADAINSVNALIYAVNRLAVFNAEKGFQAREENYDKYMKEFSNVVARPTIFDERMKIFTGSSEKTEEDLVKAVLECDVIWSDVGRDNIRCFGADFSQIDNDAAITHKSFIVAMDNYRKNPECNEKCQERIKDLIGLGVFNLENINWDNGLKITKGALGVRVCGDSTMLNEVHITTNANNCKYGGGDQEFGFMVENFALPQKVAKSANPIIYTMQEWLSAYGDPEYILFYEKFPEDEARYWHAGAYRTGFLAILGTEAVFLGIDAVTLGLGGKVLKPIAGGIAKIIPGSAIVSEGVIAIKNFVKGLTKEATDAAGRLLTKIFKKPAMWDIRRTATADQLGKGLVESAEEAEFRSIPRALVRSYKEINRARNFLKITLLGDMTDEARLKATINMVEEGQEALEHMKPNELRAFLANQQKSIDMMFDKQTGELIFGEELAKEEIEQLSKNLDKMITDYGAEAFTARFRMATTIQGYAALSPAKYNIQKALPGVLKRPFDVYRARHLVAAGAAIYAAKIESMAAKNYPIGTNSIGLKTPYKHTVVYDDTYASKISKDEFFEDFGKDEAHLGMLPEVEAYYLSLVKDQFAVWKDQPAQRFHLVSPCYADVLMKATMCECYFHPEPENGVYETGVPYELADGRTINKDFGGGKMLYRLDENENAVKECYPSALFQRDPTVYKTKCIEINPILKETDDYNYCYHGKDPAFNAVKGVIATAEIGIPMIGFAVGCVPCGIGLGFITGLAGETTKAILEKQHQWPEHS